MSEFGQGSREAAGREAATEAGLELRAVPGPLEAPGLLQAVVDAIADPVFIKDISGRYVLMNRAGAEACARPLRDIVGRTDSDLFPASVARVLQTRDSLTLRAGRTEVVEESFDVHGRVVRHLVTKVPCRDAHGRISGLIGVARDISGSSERRAMARPDTERLARIIWLQQEIEGVGLDPSAVLQKISDATREIVDATGAAVVLLDGEDLQFAATSGCAMPLAGRRMPAAGSLAGQCLLEGVPVLSDDAWTDQRANAGIVRELDAHSFLAVPLNEGDRGIGALVVIHRAAQAFSERDRQAVHLLGGSLRATLSRMAAFRANARLLHERTTALVALRESEERLQSAMEAAQIAIWEWDVPGDRLTWLGEYTGMFGTAGESIENGYARLMERVHAQDRPALDQALTAALTSGAEFSHTYRVVLPDGQIRWVGARGRFRYGESGAPERMYGAATDMTVRRALEAQLMQAQKIEAIGQLAAGIAHEINTPIQYVGDNLRFLQDGFGTLLEVLPCDREWGSATSTPRWPDEEARYLREEIPRALEQAREGVGRVGEIVRAMKDFSHPGTREPMPLDLNRAIESTVTVSRNEWKYVADLVLDLAQDLPPVPCLAGEIQQVLLNLVVNAGHAIADVVGDTGDRGTITIRTRCEADVVEVRVEDSGTGIPLEIQPRVFEPFFTTKEVGRGTGQGLALARDVVVRQHRGTLTFETEVSRGTTFIVRLPLHPDDCLGGTS